MNRPTIQSRGPAGFLLWLRQDQPAVYQRLLDTVPDAAVIDTMMREAENGTLGFFAEIGAAISRAAKTAFPKIVAALPKITATVVEVGGTVYAAKAQKDLIDAQVKQAKADQAPLATQAVVTSAGGWSMTAPQGTAVTIVRKPLIQGVPDAVVYGAGAVLALLVLKRARIL